MFYTAVTTCLFLFLVISIYLLKCSSYKICNRNGFIVLSIGYILHLIFTSSLALCQIYLLYFLVFIDVNTFDCLFHTTIVFYCVIESFFYLSTIEEARLLNNRLLLKRPVLPNNYAEQIVDRLSNVYKGAQNDFRACFTGWFNGIHQSSYDKIYEGNILDFLSMATFGVKTWNDLTKKKQKYIKNVLYKRYLKKYPEQRSNIKSGYNNQIQLKHMYRDTIEYTHYPLMKYLLFGYVRCFSIMRMFYMGFRCQSIGQITFYVRKYSEKTKSLPPILFLHGLSFGTNNYISFLHRLTTLQRTIILLEIPHSSLRIQTEVFPMSMIISSIEQLLISLNVSSVATIGHSYGTLIQSCLIKQRSHLVDSQLAIFIDPVCFLIFDAHYSENFVYRKSPPFTSCIDDLYLIYAIERHICWYECNLWAEDIQQTHIRAHVFLSENDDIVPVSFVNEYLTKSNISTSVLPKLKHAQFVISPVFQNEVLHVFI